MCQEKLSQNFKEVERAIFPDESYEVPRISENFKNFMIVPLLSEKLREPSRSSRTNSWELQESLELHDNFKVPIVSRQFKRFQENFENCSNKF